jgi:hypothetical protein
VNNVQNRTLPNLFTLVLLLVPASLLTFVMLLGHKQPALPAPVTPTQVAPTPAPVAAPAKTTATTNTAVYIRSGKGTNNSIVGMVDEGATVTLGADSDANWQEATSGTMHGYISKTYLNY